jgi:hypothetical protein
MRGKEERETMGKGGKSRASSKERKEYFHHLDKVTTSFFFTNIPDEATTEDLWKLFLKFGRVWEIYMPKKLDKRGRRFGFVKFKVVSEVELLNDKLQDVWMGTFKLLVNISRFARSDNKTDSSQSNHGTRSALQLKEVGSGSSFRTALMGGASASKAVVMKVLVNEELCKELQGSMVGTLAREKDVRRIQTTLYMEGFRSISVTHMGGNMALLRSPVEGDVARLLKSKNECMEYYFSEVKPWNPGLLAIQREVWVQIYGIPLHIWGENFFKMVGNSLGVFIDFDEETARMARFDVARIKVLTTTWAFIDESLKVEVEGVGFSLWVVEERGKQGAVVVLGDERDDVGSGVYPVEAGAEVYGDEGEDNVNSGTDESSGDEVDGNVRKDDLYGGNIDGNSEQTMRSQIPQNRNVVLTIEKSNNIANSQKESPTVPPDDVGIGEVVIRQEEKDIDLAVTHMVKDKSCFVSRGTQAYKVNENVVGGGSRVILNPSSEPLGLQDPTQLEAQENSHVMSPIGVNSSFVCEGEYGASRYSSLSEPEEVLSTIRNRTPKSAVTKLKKQKSVTKAKQIGVPKCLQLV